MKYRIKIITYKTGRKEYFAQVKYRFLWLYLFNDGTVTPIDIEHYSREFALNAIDNHYTGNKKKQTIEFEYITK